MFYKYACGLCVLITTGSLASLSGYIQTSAYQRQQTYAQPEDIQIYNQYYTPENRGYSGYTTNTPNYGVNPDYGYTKSNYGANTDYSNATPNSNNDNDVYTIWESPPPPTSEEAFPDDAEQNALYRELQNS